MFSNLLLNLILQQISLLDFILRNNEQFKSNLFFKTLTNKLTSSKVKQSVQIIIVLLFLSQYPSPIIQ